MERKANRLINEDSLYLKMHAYNPVDWYPWSYEAFEKAQKESKPIFLSIGYSSCHWCHVMEKESFEDEEVAKFLNEHFVSIKVDKEERPDIDTVYMEYCILLNNSGGWPLSVFLTPSKEPFFARTYFPKNAFLGLLRQIKELWEKDSKAIIERSKSMIEQLKSYTAERKTLSDDVIDRSYSTLYHSYDPKYGGFSEAPKFPSLQNVIFLLKNQNKNLQDMALNTLLNMRRGGIYDHIGGGFHRYSTDRYWLLPHFEKMLYDQAMSILAYQEAYRLTKDDIYKNTVYEIWGFLKDEFYEGGCFCTAMDADTEGEEGGYYLWTYDEIKNILNSDEFMEFFNIKKDGNFLDEATKKPTGKNILYAKSPKYHFQKELNMLKERRKHRPKPIIDKKILLDQNALISCALAESYIAIGDGGLLDIAKENIGLISKEPLKHALKHSKDIPAILDDYAFLIRALLSLYRASFEKEYLERAIYFMDLAIKNLWDKERGGFFLSLNSDVVLPQKPLYDGAIPSGNSVMGLNLVELFFITKEQTYEEYYQKLSALYSEMLSRAPTSANFFLTSFWLLKNAYQVSLKMPLSKAQKRIKDINTHYIPNAVFYYEQDEEEKFIVCKDYTCLSPIYNLEELYKVLGGV